MLVPAVLLGGGLAATTHGTKLGLRYAVDASPEPVTNAVANLAELTTIASIAIAVWQHPLHYIGAGVGAPPTADSAGAPDHADSQATALGSVVSRGGGGKTDKSRKFVRWMRVGSSCWRGHTVS